MREQLHRCFLVSTDDSSKRKSCLDQHSAKLNHVLSTPLLDARKGESGKCPGTFQAIH